MRRRHGCCDHTRILFNWLRYAEYVAAWAVVPMFARPACQVIRDGDGWKAVRVVR